MFQESDKEADGRPFKNYSAPQRNSPAAQAQKRLSAAFPQSFFFSSAMHCQLCLKTILTRVDAENCLAHFFRVNTLQQTHVFLGSHLFRSAQELIVKPASQAWSTFPHNKLGQLANILGAN